DGGNVSQTTLLPHSSRARFNAATALQARRAIHLAAARMVVILESLPPDHRTKPRTNSSDLSPSFSFTRSEGPKSIRRSERSPRLVSISGYTTDLRAFLSRAAEVCKRECGTSRNGPPRD